MCSSHLFSDRNTDLSWIWHLDTPKSIWGRLSWRHRASPSTTRDEFIDISTNADSLMDVPHDVNRKFISGRLRFKLLGDGRLAKCLIESGKKRERIGCSRQHFFPIIEGKGNSYEHGTRTTSLFGRGSRTRSARSIYQAHLYASGHGYFGLYWVGGYFLSVWFCAGSDGENPRWRSHGLAGRAFGIYGRVLDRG